MVIILKLIISQKEWSTMAGMLTTIGIFALFLLLVVLPVVKRQKKYETKYRIKANECKFSQRQG